MSAIGILGGMGPQASAHLVQLLVRDTGRFIRISSDTDFPEIVLHSVPVPNFISNKHHLEEAKQILIQHTRQLELAGSSINAIACNTAHLMLPALQATTTVPFVSIPQLVAQSIKERGSRRVGLLATPSTLSSTLYDEAVGGTATIIRPSHQLADQVEQQIIKQLKGSSTPADSRLLRDEVDAFICNERLDAVILGCTELPLIFGDSSGDDRIIDTLEVLSNGLLTAFFAQREAGKVLV